MSKSPLRRITEQIALTSMRPPIASQLRLYRPAAKPVDLTGKRILVTWGVFSEPSPWFSVYNASKAALSAVSRVIETEWGAKGVHSTTLYYPLVATPMIAPTKAFEGMPALTSAEAADWMVVAAQYRPVRIAPRIALGLKAIDTVVPSFANTLAKRRRI